MKYKVLRMVKRRAGESREDFARRWLAEHPKKAVVTLATGEIALGGAEAPFDGMVALYFAAAGDIRAMFAGPIPAMMRKDEENFVQMDAPAIRAVCEEQQAT